MIKWVKLTWSPSLATATTTTLSNIYVTLMATLIIVATFTTAANGFRSSSETLNAENARKLFGGYRITPKHCRATKTLPNTDPRANGPTICMFNHECAQRNGEVVGACMDGFLFGACCQIPSNHDIENTLINDAQNAYFHQHHQQHKVQQQQAVSNPAAVQSYEAYGGDSLQQQSAEYQAIESGVKYQQQQEQHQHLDVSEPENIDKVYQQLDSTNSYDKQQETSYQQVSSSSNTYSPPVSSSANYGEMSPTISSSSSSVNYGAEQQLNEEPELENFPQHHQPQEASTSDELSQSSHSLELENDSNKQSNIEASVSNTVIENHPPPTVHVKKNKVKISSPSSPPHNDDFVMQALSTLAPGHDEDHIAFTTEVPMKISSTLVDQGSSESNSFEEESTQLPQQHFKQPTRDQVMEAPQQHHQQQQHNPEPTQETQHQQHTTTTTVHSQQQSKRPSITHNHDHLLLDGGEFTHSDITHPGADTVLVEEDLQFSTGYGPVPAYAQSPAASDGTQIQYTTTRVPAAEDKYVLVQTITSDQLNKKPLPSQQSVLSSPTTSSSITTHVDSIESIILQLNNTNAGPSYNVVSQQTPSYGYDVTSDGKFEQQSGYLDSTPSPTASSFNVASTNLTIQYNDAETKRPQNFYNEDQEYPPATQQAPTLHSATSSNNSPISYDTVSNEKIDVSNSYLQNEYPTPKPAIVSAFISTDQNYGDSEAVLEDHTMPESNYNDAFSGTHPTSEFNKMPAVGIAYPVDMSYFEGEEVNIVADSSSQKPSLQVVNSQKEQSNTHQTEPQPTTGTYTRLPSVTESRPVPSYIGMITAQNFNQHKPILSIYSQVPEEVSISSQTTKVQADDHYPESASYHTAAPESSPSSYYTTSSFNPTADRATTVKPIIITASTGRPQSKPKPKPKPKPNVKRPTKQPLLVPSVGTGSKKPAKKPPTHQPFNVYKPNEAHKQPTNSYGEEPIQTKIPQPANTYLESQTLLHSQNTEPIYTKQPLQNDYLQTLVSPDDASQKAGDSFKKPAIKPVQPTSSYQETTKPTSDYQELLSPHLYITESTHTKKPAAQPAQNYPTESKPSAQPIRTHSASKQPGQQTSLNSAYDNIQQPVSTYNQAEANKRLPAQEPTASYEQESNLQKISLNTYKQPEQQIKRPSQPSINSYGQSAQNIKHSSQQPSNIYNQEQQLLVTPSKRPTTHKPIFNKKPDAQDNPVSTSYVTGPTSPRPPTTFGYHDNEVPPLLITDDKLDSFVHNTAEAVAAQNSGSPPKHVAQPSSVYVSSVTPINVQHPPANSYIQHKKPGFVKVQQPTIRPPVPTVHITPKPTVINLVTSTSWTQQLNGGIAGESASSQTTPTPAGLSSTSYIFSPLVTRRPESTSTGVNAGEYVNLPPAVNSNDFDDPGYYGAHQATNTAYIHTTTAATYGVPSDDRPAFPGYFGPTPTYPAFQVPGEKFDSPLEEETFTSPNDFVNFPPVRNPNLNMSATSSAVTSDLDLSTPSFVEDVVLKDKMNTLVHKIVESLQGNFDALANMIEDSNITAPVSTYQADTISSGGGGGATTITKKPTRKPSRVTASTKPKATTKKPITRNTTKKPAAATTRKPVTRRTTTTRKPETTRKPTKRSTTTLAPVVDEVVDEEDEEDINPGENEIQLSDTIDESGAENAGGGEGGAGGNKPFGHKFQCGVRPHVKSGRIVGGKGSTFGEFPWQVLVRESTWLGLFTKNKCGGVLITQRYVITAAHCQPGFLASLVAVMGEYDISGDLESKRAVTKNIKRVIVHRQYDPATFENDLALLEMESPVQFDTHIVPICMPSDTADFTGRMATVTGWGRLKYGGGVPSVLQEVQVPIIENSVCQEMFHTAGHNKKILNSFLCAGYANGQKDSCEGDSGGPLVLQRPDGRYELAGTVSHGIKCAAPYLPGVYMRTTFYKPWLRSITGVK